MEKVREKPVREGKNGGKLKSGNTVNLNGRPKKIPALEELINTHMTEIDSSGLSAADLVMKRLRQKAVQGDMKAIQYLLDRMYGKPKETLEHKGEIKSTSSGIGSKEWIAQMKADGYSNEEIIKVIESA